MTTKTIILNIPVTFDVDLEGDATPETIKDAIANEYVSDFNTLFNEAVDHYISTGETRNYEVEDEDTIVIDV